MRTGAGAWGCRTKDLEKLSIRHLRYGLMQKRCMLDEVDFSVIHIPDLQHALSLMQNAVRAQSKL